MRADLAEQGIQVVFADPVPKRRIVFPPGTPKILKRNIQNTVEVARNYASGNHMVDDWGNDKARRTKFQTEMTRKYGALFSNLENANRLRGTPMGQLLSRVRVLIHIFELSEVPVPEELKTIAAKLPEFTSEEYATKELAEKMKFVESYTSAARKLLLLFTEPFR